MFDRKSDTHIVSLGVRNTWSDAALDHTGRYSSFGARLLNRHAKGDFGSISEEQKQKNEEIILNGLDEPIISRYPFDGDTVIVKTYTNDEDERVTHICMEGEDNAS